MSKIFFNGHLVWDKQFLPNSHQAQKLFEQYAPSASVADTYALSAGIDVILPEGEFTVELSTDKRARELIGGR